MWAGNLRTLKTSYCVASVPYFQPHWCDVPGCFCCSCWYQIQRWQKPKQIHAYSCAYVSIHTYMWYVLNFILYICMIICVYSIEIASYDSMSTDFICYNIFAYNVGALVIRWFITPSNYGYLPTINHTYLNYTPT